MALTRRCRAAIGMCGRVLSTACRPGSGTASGADTVCDRPVETGVPDHRKRIPYRGCGGHVGARGAHGIVGHWLI